MKYKFILVFCMYILFVSCGNDGRGYEYMPNMYRSPSLETYGMNTVFKDSINARKPVKGTIARGYLKTFNYDETLEGYLLAGREAKNPLEKNKKNLQDGEALYIMFCKHCHGPNGAGGGSITHPIYSAVPHYNDNKQIRRTGGTMSDLKAGHLYHAITYGLNAMGPHASQITEKERWKIVLYVQELQKYTNE
ncbi:MAG: cytochrome C [Flavobacteriales bacterium]|nr:cytochrome C [Flavobacteriales bacterium]|tara:strand:+ start:8695 stop:9270 length:576 start_codon:yes stop_codon:yes gene_type:complete